MTPAIRPLVAGNWKMNGTSASLNELLAIGHGFMSGLDAETEALLCVPATLLVARCRNPVAHAGQEPAARIATARKAAPTPATSPPRC